MRLPIKARDLPGRVTTGGYILHTGLEKWHGDEARAEALHRMAANAFPILTNKDVWMLGIGLGLVTGALDDRRNGS